MRWFIILAMVAGFLFGEAAEAKPIEPARIPALMASLKIPPARISAENRSP